MISTTSSKIYQLKHLEHPEDNIFVSGVFDDTLKVLLNVHQSIAEGPKKDVCVSTKIDGAPAVVFGIHPKTKKFFVGTKAVFNKKPKINYTMADIERNHGHSPGLVLKLKEALKYLPDITTAGIYQGDILFDIHDKKEDQYGIHFTPNTIKYTVNTKHKAYKVVKAAKIGIAIHTIYKGQVKDSESLTGISASFNKFCFKLDKSMNVHQSDLDFKVSTVESYTHKLKIEKMLGTCQSNWHKMSGTDKEVLFYHGQMFKTFINFSIRRGDKITVEKYEKYALEKMQKKIDSMKSDKGKEKYQNQKNEMRIRLKADRVCLENALKLWHLIQATKDLIVDAMNTAKHQYQHTIDGTTTNPEGFVASTNGVPIKLVHRHEFSKLNFQNTRF